MILVAHNYSPKVLQPRKQAFDFSSSFVTPEFSALLGCAFFLLALCGAINSISSFFNCLSNGSESYALSPIIFSGRSLVKRSVTVRSTNFTSCGEAELVWTARGRPEPSATAMSFVPLPRLVFPTAKPLF